MIMDFDFSYSTQPMGEMAGVRYESGWFIQFYDNHSDKPNGFVYRFTLEDARKFHKALGCAIAALEAAE